MNANINQPISFIVFTLAYFSCAYLVGSIPIAWLVARLVTGEDLRRLGSGNVGVMNTALSVARWAGLLVFASEITKGMLAIIIPRSLGADNFWVSVSVIGAVIGTRWPAWLGFKGGRGNTTGLAACAMVSPLSIVALAVFWYAARVTLKKSFIATRLTMLAIPVIFWLFTGSAWFSFTGLALSLIYLKAQQRSTDDHLAINQRWSSFWGFLTSPPRRH